MKVYVLFIGTEGMSSIRTIVISRLPSTLGFFVVLSGTYQGFPRSYLRPKQLPTKISKSLKSPNKIVQILLCLVNLIPDISDLRFL